MDNPRHARSVPRLSGTKSVTVDTSSVSRIQFVKLVSKLM